MGPCCAGHGGRERATTFAARPQFNDGPLARAQIPKSEIRMTPQPVTGEVLAGVVERVTYHNAENGFCVLRARARGHRDIVTVVGHAAAISAGEWVMASGQWVNDRTHGQQFKAHFLRTSAPTSADGIERYLSSGMIRGVGPVYAKKLVRAHSARRFSTSSRPARIACARSMASGRFERPTFSCAPRAEYEYSFLAVR